MLDRAGRLQLPRAHVEALELRDRVRLRLEEDHVGVWPDLGDRAPRPDTPVPTPPPSTPITPEEPR